MLVAPAQPEEIYLSSGKICGEMAVCVLFFGVIMMSLAMMTGSHGAA